MNNILLFLFSIMLITIMRDNVEGFYTTFGVPEDILESRLFQGFKKKITIFFSFEQKFLFIFKLLN
jgi:hypothetical protein